MREIKFRAWHATNKIMVAHREISVGLKNINNKSGWEYMQWTCLLDKNGVPIYEGDILSVASQIVSSNDPAPGTRMICEDPDSKQLTDAFMDGNCRTSGFVFGERAAKLHYEVIGNIHENPELLK